jgi:hypothetical protein
MQTHYKPPPGPGDMFFEVADTSLQFEQRKLLFLKVEQGGIKGGSLEEFPRLVNAHLGQWREKATG